MQNFVNVIGDEMGNVITPSSNNDEYGYVRVEQKAATINTEGWVKVSKRSAIIKGKIEDLKQFGFQKDKTIPGKIIVKESFVPFNIISPERDLKYAGDTGVVCRVDDQPIYRQSFFTTDLNQHDDLISHNNSDEIREAQVTSRSMSSLIEKMSMSETQL
jgi:hypothetical protein